MNNDIYQVPNSMNSTARVKTPKIVKVLITMNLGLLYPVLIVIVSGFFCYLWVSKTPPITVAEMFQPTVFGKVYFRLLALDEYIIPLCFAVFVGNIISGYIRKNVYEIFYCLIPSTLLIMVWFLLGIQS